MPFNRIRGFYIRPVTPPEKKPMSADETNNDLNARLNGRVEALLEILNYVIEHHEKAMRAMTIFRDVSFTYETLDMEDDGGNPTGEQTARLLGILKWNGSLRLCHGCYETREGTHWKPLADSSVADRLRAIPHIDKLRQAVIDDKGQLESEVASAGQTAISLLEGYLEGTTLAQQVRSDIQFELEKAKKAKRKRNQE